MGENREPDQQQDRDQQAAEQDVLHAARERLRPSLVAICIRQFCHRVDTGPEAFANTVLPARQRQLYTK